MANIMITERCNLQCEYCFANEFVNGIEKKDITIPQLQRILKFIIGDGTEVYGRIYNSVIGSGVTIEEGAVVRDSIIMNNSVIGRIQSLISQ